MTEDQYIELCNLLRMFIDDCGLDRIEACKQAQELLKTINNN